MQRATHTHLGVRLLSRDAQLQTENGNFEIPRALVTKVHLAVLRELDGAPVQPKTIRAPRPAGNGKHAAGFVSYFGGRQSIVVRLLSPVSDDAARVPGLILLPTNLSWMILAIAVDNSLDPG